MIKKDIIVPKAWDDVFRIVQAQYPDALLAGGALRDIDCARTPKDLDIFVCNKADGNGCDPVMIPGYTVDTTEEFDSSNAFDDTLMSSEVLTNGVDLPVNIIYLSSDCSPMQRFDRFDFGLNKIAYDGKTVFAHSQYSEDKNNHRFTLRRAENDEQINRSLERAMKFQEKYGGWDLVIPGNFIPRAFHAVRNVALAQDAAEREKRAADSLFASLGNSLGSKSSLEF